ncbi:efflux RND transporter permease subunit [Rhodospirillum centenum]|uniref:Membrane protein, putative n=1 Tax=Rhodospirillum centenum (strain ATCC 51521 / SW) TaxID=414684 RepID=B6IWX7_RHOCS|nr:MMPL family transporter [Rhodospirillum centenum]ACJ00801.1 membrane protein, putative [Rhodospirillum centenum SW]
MSTPFLQNLEGLVFRNRALLLVLFALATLFMGWNAAKLRVDAGFEKMLPIDHPYMDTFLTYQQEFGGANRIVVALSVDEGDIYTPDFMARLKKVTDEVFFIPGVDRASVTSLFTPNVRFVEITAEGFSGGNVIPAEFQPTEEWMPVVRENVLKSGTVGRLVGEKFDAALVSAQLIERDPRTGEKLDYQAVADKLEAIRARHADGKIDIHIIGFAKSIGDIADGASSVVTFFVIAFVITALLVYGYGRSFMMMAVMLLVSLTTVVWQFGMLVLLGFGIDPLSILVPFLVFAIAVSHGVQNIGTISQEMGRGADAYTAARISFERLLIPGSSALVTDALGFLTIAIIQIRMIQELAVSASVGMVIIILTHLFILPVLLSYLPLDERYRARVAGQVDRFDPLWRRIAVLATPKGAVPMVLAALLVLGGSFYIQKDMTIGDTEAGVPELWPDSRYNRDAALIVDRFSIGTDVIQVIAEAPANGCIDYGVIRQIDDFTWHMSNVPGVQSAFSLSTVMKGVNTGWNEGNLNWQVLPRNSQVLVRTVTPIETSTGLLNADCSVMPVVIYTVDHRAETIDRIVQAVEGYVKANPSDEVRFRLATGNVGVMAATNEAVREAEKPMLGLVYATVVLFCLITFRSLVGSLATVLPLIVVSILCNALMTVLGIGLKISTLPAAALGVGIGVDYGLYIFNRLQAYLKHGLTFAEAYFRTLQETGSSVLFTGITLAVGTATWAFSDLKFQADMGVLLTFIFLANMVGAVILLPAVASLLYSRFPRLFEKEVERASRRTFAQH